MITSNRLDYIQHPYGRVTLTLKYLPLFLPTELQYLQADYNGRYINAGTQISRQLPHVG